MPPRRLSPRGFSVLPGQYHKSAGTLSSRVPEGQYSGGSGYVDNRFGW
ncbi:MAG: hypothetical protein KIT68_05685 [Phycisphaeraceae bacterium]|nr:hypothetical protein [Phycisphaeraceae bacterium]